MSFLWRYLKSVSGVDHGFAKLGSRGKVLFLGQALLMQTNAIAPFVNRQPNINKLVRQQHNQLSIEISNNSTKSIILCLD